MKFTLHFHLGPVQSFIGEARRTRDIWAGSFILSWLCAEAFVEAMGKPIGKERVKSPLSFNEDPIFNAVHAHRFGGGTIGRPVCSTFPNHFSINVDQIDAGEQAARRVRQCWLDLSGAVESLIFDTRLEGTTLGERYPFARQLFAAQTGTAEATPLWEIYAVVEKYAKSSNKGGTKPDSGSDALAMRKLQRWGEDARLAPSLQFGGFCSMLPGWQEISGTEDLGDREREEFWAAVRRVLLIARYGERSSDRVCLDLAQKERLSAPALVKRLFPLLRDAKLREIFGWVPVMRSSIVESKETQADEDWGKALLGRIWPSLFGSPTTALELSIFETDEEGNRQSASLWPSTSYLSAAHWIERVHQSAPPALTSSIRAAIRAAGTHLAVAEQSLFVPCTRVGLGGGDLRAVDGACLFENSLTRMEKESGNAAFSRVRELLATLAKTPIDPNCPDLGTIGRPAPVYAIVRADGDEMGKRLSENSEISRGLGKFTAVLRGGGKEGDIGVIAQNNGVTLYASADEMIAMCPMEDALSLAMAVRKAFMDAMVPYQKDKPLTLSVAITYAHRQVPLNWVMRSGVSLLDGVAKDYVGGNALAIEVMDAGGRRLQWAAPWHLPAKGTSGAAERNPQLDGLNALVAAVTSSTGRSLAALGSNQFFHDFAEVMDPFLLPVDDGSISAAQSALTAELREFQYSVNARGIIEKLLGHLLESTYGVAGEHLDQIRESILAISGILVVKSPSERVIDGRRLSTSGMKLLRFLAENWRQIDRGAQVQ